MNLREKYKITSNTQLTAYSMNPMAILHMAPSILAPPLEDILYDLVHLSEALSSKQNMGDAGIMVSCSISMLVAMPLATICLWYCKTVKLHLLKSFPIKIQQYPVQGWFSNLTFVMVCNNMYFMVSRTKIKNPKTCFQFKYVWAFLS